jgi:hypothetical protein
VVNADARIESVPNRTKPTLPVQPRDERVPNAGRLIVSGGVNYLQLALLLSSATLGRLMRSLQHSTRAAPTAGPYWERAWISREGHINTRLCVGNSASRSIAARAVIIVQLTDTSLFAYVGRRKAREFRSERPRDPLRGSRRSLLEVPGIAAGRGVDFSAQVP